MDPYLLENVMSVGIVFGPNDIPLWCKEYKKEYYVINGAWSFSKKVGPVKGEKWRVVVTEFPEEMRNKHYNEVCTYIEDMAKEERKNESIQRNTPSV